VKWLLDANVISEYVRAKPSRSVLDWIARRPSDQFAVSIVTFAELRLGALLASTKQRRDELNLWIDGELSSTFSSTTLPLTIDIIIDWLQLSQKLAAMRQSRPAVDLLLAATARTRDLILVTCNVRDFVGTGVILYDPWSGKTHDMHVM
jgi:toxin FitB